jgi:hypothetical protein
MSSLQVEVVGHVAVPSATNLPKLAKAKVAARWARVLAPLSEVLPDPSIARCARIAFLACHRGIVCTASAARDIPSALLSRCRPFGATNARNLAPAPQAHIDLLAPSLRRHWSSAAASRVDMAAYASASAQLPTNMQCDDRDKDDDRCDEVATHHCKMCGNMCAVTVLSPYWCWFTIHRLACTASHLMLDCYGDLTCVRWVRACRRHAVDSLT